MRNNYNDEEQIVSSAEKIKKTSKFTLITLIRIAWTISFISWCYFTFIITNNPNQKGMWISLSFMWIFLILNNIFKNK